MINFITVMTWPVLRRVNILALSFTANKVSAKTLSKEYRILIIEFDLKVSSYDLGRKLVTL
jgi:hypothetical protein